MKRILEVKLHENAVAAFGGVVCFFVYRTTMAPGLSFIDSGELAAVATTLGIAHPTGYPLFSLLGRIVVMLPPGSEEITRLNLFGSLATSLAVVFFFKCAVRMQTFVIPGKERSNLGDLLPALAGSLVFGLSTTVWAQSVVIEVYALHLFLLVTMLSTFLKAMSDLRADPTRVPRSLFLASFLLGLGFANHMTTILIVPALLFLYARTWGFHREGSILLGKLLLFFLLGLSLYLYLPLRAAGQPVLDWGHPVSFEKLFWHASGKQYRSWIFSGFETAGKQFRYFASNLTTEFHWVACVVALLGVLHLLRRSRQLLYFLGIAGGTCLFYSINYDIHDIDSYFLLVYVVIGLLIIFGFEYLRSVVMERVVTWIVLAMFTIPVLQYAGNKNEVDESDNFLVHDYTMNILNNLEQEAVVFSYQWDFFVSPSLYYQRVRGVRPDVLVIDKELLRRSWYFIHLEHQVPWLIERSKDKVGAFLGELYKFEHDLPYNPQVIESRFVEMINDFIEKTMEDRPVYVGPEIEVEFGSKHKRVPEGLLFRLMWSEQPVLEKKPQIFYRKAKIENAYSKLIKVKYAQMLTLTALRLRDEGKLREASEVVAKVVEIEPAFQPARQLWQQLESLEQRR